MKCCIMLMEIQWKEMKQLIGMLYMFTGDALNGIFNRPFLEHIWNPKLFLFKCSSTWMNFSCSINLNSLIQSLIGLHKHTLLVRQ